MDDPARVQETYAWIRHVARELSAVADANDGCDADPRATANFSTDAMFPLDDFCEALLRGINKYTDIQTISSLMVLSTCLLRRLPHFEACVQPKTVRRLLFTAIYAAIKVHIDETLSIREYVRITKCTISCATVARMEMCFASLLKWKFHICPTEYEEAATIHGMPFQVPVVMPRELLLFVAPVVATAAAADKHDSMEVEHDVEEGCMTAPNNKRFLHISAPPRALPPIPASC